MASVKYHDLIVWQKSMDLVTEIYRLARLLPKEEMFALSSQMKRAAISIPSNIAEGQERNTTKEFVQLLYTAKSSKGELETLLLICVKLRYFKQFQTEFAQSLLNEIGKTLNSLIKVLTTSH